MVKDKQAENAYKKRIQELEKELSHNKLRVSYLECLIEASEKLGVHIEKKQGKTPFYNVKSKIPKKQ